MQRIEYEIPVFELKGSWTDICYIQTSRQGCVQPSRQIPALPFLTDFLRCPDAEIVFGRTREAFLYV